MVLLPFCNKLSALIRNKKNKFGKLSFFLVLLVSLLAFTTEAVADKPISAVPGQYIVKYKANKNTRAKAQLSYNLNAQVLRTSKLTGAQLIQTSGELNENYAKQLMASGEIEYIEPNYIYTIDVTPNDTSYSELWGMNNSGANGGLADVDVDGPEAWDITKGSNAVIVGVVDTGVNYNHEDLSANMWRNPGETPGNGIDDDGNGFVDDVYGYNAAYNNGNPLDDNNHGSHVAGTIGAVGNNGKGVVGVNWNVKIMALKFLNSAGSGTSEDAIEAIEYAVMMKNRGVNIQVLNNSWGGGGFSQALRDAINEANNAGILFVAASGNSSKDTDINPNYPSGYDIANVLSVAAVDNNGNLASFSNYGESTVDVAAPGVSILSTMANGGYGTMSGTSMATPHVAGVAALVLANESSITIPQLKERLMNTVKPLPSLYNQMVAPGTVSAYNALTNTIAPTPPPSSPNKYSKGPMPINYSETLGERVLNSDDGYSEQFLPFSFPYYGEFFSRIAISANGRVIPLGENDAMPVALDYTNKLSEGINPYHDDLYPYTDNPNSGVWYKANSTSTTITWIASPFSLRSSTDTNKGIIVQLKIFSNGKIEFHYKDTFTGNSMYDFGASASVGIIPPSGISGSNLIVSHNGPNENEIGNEKALAIFRKTSKALADFDGDGKSDISVWRPSTGRWYILTSSSDFDPAQSISYKIGKAGDTPLSGDYDGDGISDLATWRPSNGKWYLLLSSTGFTTTSSYQWGLAGDVPLSADYDGDGRTDLAVYRSTEQKFYVLRSSSGFNRTAALSGNEQAYYIIQGALGSNNYPVVGDFNGDGTDDFTTIWDVARFWVVKSSTGGKLYDYSWGIPGDTPVSCDWDNDGVNDRVMVRINEERKLDWWVATARGNVFLQQFGKFGDQVNCSRDYDGDGQGDMSTYRQNSGRWYITMTTTGIKKGFTFGEKGDIAD